MKSAMLLFIGAVLCSGQTLDRKYFPGMPDTFRVAADRTFLNAADWNPQKNISVRSDCDGLTVSSGADTVDTCRYKQENGSRQTGESAEGNDKILSA